MIPNISEVLLKQSQWESQSQEKKLFRARRKMAMDYYNGRTKGYTENKFSKKLRDSIPIANVNITKRVIDRISMVYMIEPIRTYSKPEITDYFYEKDHKLQRLERYTNLLDAVLIKPTWRNGQIEYDIIHDFEPHFGDDPMKPIAYTYPLSIKSEVLDDTPELFAYWDMENTFVYDGRGKIQQDPNNPDHVNFYGILPFVECWREGKPEYAYFDTDPAMDLIETNYLINVAETNKMANVHYQSFGYLTVTGSQVDKKDLMVGQGQIMYLGIDGRLSVTAPPNSIPALSEAIKDSYKMLTQNYGLPTSFAEGTSAESGGALRLRSQELHDNRKSDLVRWNDIEHKLFQVEHQILTTEEAIDVGELENVDYNESTEILNPQEQIQRWDWELDKGIKDLADIIMERDPDKFEDRAAAQEYLAERSGVSDEPEEASPLLAALTKPV